MMNCFRIAGGIPLNGEVVIQGSKNAALPIMAATILTDGVTILHRCPRIKDVFLMQHLLESMGCRMRWEQDTLSIDTTGLPKELPEITPVVGGSLGMAARQKSSMRSTITLLGALLGRFGSCYMDYRGGCVIGKRPIDMHLSALETMGAEFEQGQQGLYAKSKALHGAEISLRFPSVGVTENVLLAAACAEGETILHGAAREPEVEALCEYLQLLGCEIFRQREGDGRAVLQLKPREGERFPGGKRLEYTIPADRIVAGTYLFACMGTGGEVYLRDAPAEHLDMPLQIMEAMGAVLERDHSGIYLKAPRDIRPQQIETAVYPGFPTDLQSQLLVVLCRALGESKVRETVFENRFRIVEELNRMGADISVKETQAIIKGKKKFHAEDVEARELRGGAALVLAGLMADGETRVSGRHFIERGYENISRDLRDLGARISFE